MTNCSFQKRDGRVEHFDPSKISNAIKLSYDGFYKNIKGPIPYNNINAHVLRKITNYISTNDLTVIHLEEIQDLVISFIGDLDSSLAKSFSDYRSKRMRGRKIDPVKLFKNYMKSFKDDRVTYSDGIENANMGASFQSFFYSLSSAATKQITMDQLLTEEQRVAHRDAFIHIHDLDMGITPYCSGWSMHDLLTMGFNAPNAASSGPAKHLGAALGQMNNFLGSAQNEWAGAMAFNNVDTYLAPFVRKDKLTYKQVKQHIQSFIHNVNTTSRWGGQSPFTNVSLDITCPKKMIDEPVIIGGKFHDSWTFGDMKKEQDMVCKAFIEVMYEGDYDGNIFSFPIPTFNIVSPDQFEGEIGELMLKLTAKYGVPYFQNFIGTDLDPDSIRSMCPIHPDERVIVFDGKNVRRIPIGTVYAIQERDDATYQVLYDGNWYDAKANSMPCETMYELKFSNAEKIRLDGRHIQPRIVGNHNEQLENVKVENLRIGDLIPWVGQSNLDPICITEITTIDYEGPVHCFEVDSENHLFEMANGLVTHNCRLSLDVSEDEETIVDDNGEEKKVGGLFGAGSLTGSIGVSTLNLAKFGYLADTEDEFLSLVDKYCELCYNILESKRAFLDEMLELGFYPITKKYLIRGFSKHFSTIGVIGGNEACLNLFGEDISTEKSIKFMQKVLMHIKAKKKEFNKRSGNKYNVEATPGEGAGFRLAKRDKMMYRDIIQNGSDEIPYYTNSTALDVSHTSDIIEALLHQNQLQPLYDGGTVYHTFVGEQIDNLEGLKNFLIDVCTNTQLPYVSITPTFSICADCGYLHGEHFICPKCQKPADVYTRVVGYVRPVRNFNPGKKIEYNNRCTYLDDGFDNAKFPDEKELVMEEQTDSEKEVCEACV